ncbi:MAG TPA: DoxX family protein [Pseudonocardiaceae bacterium]|nr:DoxX family protein [Pseudonocardiaceae bacterium]
MSETTINQVATTVSAPRSATANKLTTTNRPATAVKTGTATKSTRATSVDQAGPRGAVVLSLVRIVVSLLWICHGLQGLIGLFGGVDGHGTALPPSSGLAFWASLIETVVGVVVLLGLATRPAAVLCSGVMAFAYFTVHAPTGLFPIVNGGEEAALYSWIFLLIAVLGPGRLAVDTVIRRHRAARR